MSVKFFNFGNSVNPKVEIFKKFADAIFQRTIEIQFGIQKGKSSVS